MKTPFEPNDPLLGSLIEDSRELPRAAAAQARSRRHAQTNLTRGVLAMAVLFLAVGIWFSNHSPRGESTREIAKFVKPPEAAKLPARTGYVKVFAADEPVEHEPIPSDATEREKRLLTELPGVPLLIVRNDAGEVARVHIFER